MKKIFFYTGLFIWLLFLPSLVYSQEFVNDYRVEYFIKDQGERLTSEVKFNIKITHQRSDIYVKKYSLAFPKFFSVKNISASDDKGPIEPKITANDRQTVIELEFNNPATGKGSSNNLYLNFNQENLFKVNGNVWEVILPTIDNREKGDYTVVVNLPEETDNKISIAKPKPTMISGKQLIWHNPKTKTIYAVFGDKQYYQTRLIYNLGNPKLIPVYTDIALPPDTLHQKIFFDSLTPKADKIFIDQDGNLMARYQLKPKESKTIIFEGTIAVFSQPRPERQILERALLKDQAPYLLTEKKYWQITNPKEFTSLKSPADIYNFVVKTLSYDYQKINTNAGRTGADAVLKNPNKAVCTEFTDLFIGLSREKGIYSREIQGYGFSSDSQLRPLSFVNDTLHAWPEYYDQQKQLWISVDPTWEDTSGIDYFSSFDLNHIVFAIHGKDPIYPYPAGMYKIENSKDIILNSVNQIPEEIKNVNFSVIDLKNILYQNKPFQIKIQITNLGNTYSYNQSYKIYGKDISFNPADFIVDQIAPGEKKEFIIKVNPKKVYSRQKTFVIISDSKNEPVFKQVVKIFPFYYDLAIKYSFVGLILLLIFIYRYYHGRKIS